MYETTYEVLLASRHLFDPKTDAKICRGFSEKIVENVEIFIFAKVIWL